ncbi:MAG: flagellar hook protein FlgE [Methylococcaceae bacterium]
MGITINSEALNNAAIGLNVIGNNIANVNTSGFKEASFSELLKKASGGSSETAGITQAFTQGSISPSTNPLDMAISGNSLFRLDGGNGITYTRNGQFTVNSNNYIVNSFGDKLTGYSVDGTGKLDTNTLSDISIDTGKSSPSATTKIQLEVSLNRLKTANILPSTPAFDSGNSSTYDNSITTTAYDASGSARLIQSYFRQTDVSAWDMYTIDPTIATISNPFETAKIPFGTDGKILAGKTTYDIGGLKIDLANSSAAAGSFSLARSSQDGKTSSDMSSYKVNNDGKIEVIYADGTSAIRAQVVLAKFDNLQGLTASSNNQWTESSLSGKPRVGVAGSGGFGSIQGGSIEGSNVDLTTEMVKLIAAQRAFQSAAEVVKKQDETVQTINRIGG